jgi:hypothetical protein
MTNENKTSITEAIDAAGYEWQVQESTATSIDGVEITLTETVTFTASKVTKIQRP